MITKISSSGRYHAEHGWLSTYFLFSFAEYYDPQNLEFGNVRVFNDDTIAPHSGFSEHDHDNMEIVTIVHEGVLTHRDSMGSVGAIGAGEVQYMSAGTGVTHAEMNDGSVPVHLYQIWLYPNEHDAMPRYEQKQFSEIPKNELVPFASGHGKTGALTIRSDATIYCAEIEAGKKLTIPVGKGRGLFVYIRDGELNIDGNPFAAGDQARIKDEGTVVAMGVGALSKLVVIETAV